MPVQSTDLILVEREGTPYRTTAGAVAALGGGGSLPNITVGETPPPSPEIGDLWVDTSQ